MDLVFIMHRNIPAFFFLVDKIVIFFIVQNSFSNLISQPSQVAHFFDSTLEHGADAKLACNWIMGDIAAYLKNEKLSIHETKLTPLELSELIASIKNGTISGKIGKEVPLLNCFFFPFSCYSFCVPCIGYRL